MKHLKMIVVILVVLIAFIVAVQNFQALATPVQFRVNLLFFDEYRTSMPLSLVAIITFLIGVIFMGFYGMAERFTLKRQIKTLLKESREKDRELNSLRNLPVTNGDVSSVKSSEE
jgi:putative membrane protein